MAPMIKIMRPHPLTRLLEQGIPLTLMMDLLAPNAPDSLVIYLTERAPELSWWESASAN
jgi:hypothetical protein